MPPLIPSRESRISTAHHASTAKRASHTNKSPSSRPTITMQRIRVHLTCSSAVEAATSSTRLFQHPSPQSRNLHHDTSSTAIGPNTTFYARNVLNATQAKFQKSTLCLLPVVHQAWWQGYGVVISPGTNERVCADPVGRVASIVLVYIHTYAHTRDLPSPRLLQEHVDSLTPLHIPQCGRMGSTVHRVRHPIQNIDTNR
jgi:hypothetical protein